MKRPGLDCSGFEFGTWLTLANAVVNLQVPENAENFLTILGLISFSGRTLLNGVSLS